MQHLRHILGYFLNKRTKCSYWFVVPCEGTPVYDPKMIIIVGQLVAIFQKQETSAEFLVSLATCSFKKTESTRPRQRIKIH